MLLRNKNFVRCTFSFSGCWEGGEREREYRCICGACPRALQWGTKGCMIMGCPNSLAPPQVPGHIDSKISILAIRANSVKMKPKISTN